MQIPKLFCASIAALILLPVQAEVKIPEEYKINGFALGCQAYSFNRFSAFEAIEKTAQAGGKIIEFYPGQKLSREEPDRKLDHNMSAEDIEKLKSKLRQHQIKAVNYGVVGLPNNEAECRKVFEFARKMGLRAVTSEPAPEALDLIERLVKEYDIMMAIHNHPRRPDRPAYKVWDPNYVLSLVKDRDRRLGACADTGHWVRSEIKPVDALRILEGRVISSHLKDLHEFGPQGHDVPFGEGYSDVPAILDELRRQNFNGNISIEYEYNWENSVPDITRCVDFVRNYKPGTGKTKGPGKPTQKGATN